MQPDNLPLLKYDNQLLTIVESCLSDLEWISRQIYQMEQDVAESFPEIQLDQSIDIARKLSANFHVELQDCKIVIREAFYALEPIIQAKQIF